jgi:hypothetical protein
LWLIILRRKDHPVKGWVGILVSGVLIWLIAFAVAFALFPVRQANRPLFESIMPVVIAVATVFFGVRHLRGVGTDFVLAGFVMGVVWLAINIVIDLPLFLLAGPMQTTLGDYLADIGVTYLMIPVITTGLGAVLARRPR